MKVEVTYVGQVRAAAGTSIETVELDDSATVAACATQLADRHGEEFGRLLLDDEGVLRPSILVFLADEQIQDAASTTLADGNVLTFLTPLAGG